MRAVEPYGFRMNRMRISTSGRCAASRHRVGHEVDPYGFHSLPDMAAGGTVATIQGTHKGCGYGNGIRTLPGFHITRH